MRIQKYISETGFCSRRETDRLILEERITINGVISQHNSLVEPGDLVLIDGKPIPLKEAPIYIVFNKPEGITCTAAKHIEGNIIDFVNHPKRIFPVGRLDKASKGLILLTNDGSIVNKISRLEYGHEKEYVVEVDKPFDDDFIKGMANGVEILGVVTKKCKVSRISDSVFRIVLKQGLNRQIRRMSKALGYKVVSLERVRIMNILLDDLECGEWRELRNQELEELLALLQ